MTNWVRRLEKHCETVRKDLRRTGYDDWNTVRSCDYWQGPFHTKLGAVFIHVLDVAGEEFFVVRPLSPPLVGLRGSFSFVFLGFLNSIEIKRIKPIPCGLANTLAIKKKKNEIKEY